MLDATGYIGVGISSLLLLFVIFDRIFGAGKRSADNSTKVDGLQQRVDVQRTQLDKHDISLNRLITDVAVIDEKIDRDKPALAQLITDVAVIKDKTDVVWKTCIESSLNQAWRTPFAKEGNSLTPQGVDLVTEFSDGLITTLEKAGNNRDEAVKQVVLNYSPELHALAMKHQVTWEAMMGLVAAEYDSIIKVRKNGSG
jgi:hypothetical protein